MVTNPFGAVATLRDDEPASRVFSSGMRLGRYELLTRVGKGGMASVWAARQHGERGFTKAVAVKTILPHLACEEEFETLFLREARIASTIRHPNVCEVYDLGEDAGTLYMAMEWINGDSLAGLLHARPSGGPVRWPLAARIVADACAGLHAAHTTRDGEGRPMNILHRDISPQNVLISDSGIVKLADFGIAKASMSLSAMTRSGFMRGKLGYCSPERVSGTTYDQRADVYALGCVLYELLTGRPPFVADDDVKLLVDITAGNYRPISASLEVPAALVDLVARAIAADPEERVQSADQLRVSLETLLFERRNLVSAHHLAGTVKTRLGNLLQERQRTIQKTLDRLGAASYRTRPPGPPTLPSLASSSAPSSAPLSFAPPSVGPLGSAAPPPPWSSPHPFPAVELASGPTIGSLAPAPASRWGRAGVALVAMALTAGLLATALTQPAVRGAFSFAKVAAHAPAAASLPTPVPVPVPEAEPVAPETVRAVAPLPLAEKPAAKPFGGHPRTKPPADEVVGDKLQLDLPPVPAEAPTVSTPSNPY